MREARDSLVADLRPLPRAAGPHACCGRCHARAVGRAVSALPLPRNTGTPPKARAPCAAPSLSARPRPAAARPAPPPARPPRRPKPAAAAAPPRGAAPRRPCEILAARGRWPQTRCRCRPDVWRLRWMGVVGGGTGRARLPARRRRRPRARPRPSLTSEHHLPGHKHKQHHLGALHAVDQAGKELRLVRAEEAVRVRETLEPHREPDVGRRDDVLHFEIFKGGGEAELLHDFGVLRGRREGATRAAWARGTARGGRPSHRVPLSPSPSPCAPRGGPPPRTWRRCRPGGGAGSARRDGAPPPPFHLPPPSRSPSCPTRR